VNEARALRVGDPLVVTIADLEGPGKGTVVKADVDPKGEITLPMLSKPVPAQALTREKLRDAIVRAYERDKLIANAIVTVKFRNPEKEPPASKE
jgi:protein involved in polysaccharide export with SLBB domain